MSWKLRGKNQRSLKTAFIIVSGNLVENNGVWESSKVLGLAQDNVLGPY
jgi:hypothetical protein